ncbi:hypothetical protein [Coleofasciculus sp. E2-BRE-01]|uniref:hypothetical protein n=1 Tax=Coleofasciculus sp. E2-BRE-01 TaxID=3069524 RepID=UPI0033051416
MKARLSKGVGCRVSGVGCRVSGVRMDLSVGGEQTSHLPPFTSPIHTQSYFQTGSV